MTILKEWLYLIVVGGSGTFLIGLFCVWQIGRASGLLG